MIKVTGSDHNLNQNKVDESRRRDSAVTKNTAKAATNPTAAKTAETVAVSGMAREVGKVSAQVKNVPDVRREKVQAIKEKIDSGKYFVSSNDIAGKMIEDIVRQGK